MIFKNVEHSKVQYILDLELKVNSKEREIYFDNYPNHHAYYISINEKPYEPFHHRKIRTVFHERFLERIETGKSLILRTGGPLLNYRTEDVKSLRIKLACPDEQYYGKVTSIKERMVKFSELWIGTLETETLSIKSKDASNKAL